MEQTPYTLDLMIRRLERADLKQCFPVAQLTAIVASFLRDTKKRSEAFSPWDFVPEHLWPEDLQAKKAMQGRYEFKDLTPKGQRRMLEAFFSRPTNPKPRKGKRDGTNTVGKSTADSKRPQGAGKSTRTPSARTEE